MNHASRLAAVLLFAAGAARAETAAPKFLADVGGYSSAVSEDGKFIAVAQDDAVVVWDTGAGKPIARVELPAPKLSNAKENLRSGDLRGAFSRDGKILVLGRGWRDDGPFVGHAELFLIDVAAEKVVRRLFEHSHRCAHEHKKTNPDDLAPVLCGGPGGWLMGGFESVSLSPDASRVAFSLAQTDGRDGEYETSMVVMDLGGKVIQERKLTSYRRADGDKYWTFDPEGGTSLVLGGYDPEGRLTGVSADAATCQGLDLLAGGKRLAFLDSCNRTSAPQRVSADGRLGLSFDKEKRALKVWKLASGVAAVDKSFAPLPDGVEAYTGGFSIDGRSFALRERLEDGTTAVSVYLTENGERRVALRDDPAWKIVNVDALGSGRLLMTVDAGNYDWKHKIAAIPEAAGAVASAKPEARPDVDEPPATKTKADPDAYAVVIGIEKYRQDGIPSVDFAARDAKTMYAYLTKAMGFDPKNVMLLTDERATKTDLEKNLGTWLENRVGAKSRVFVYYAGHGSPNTTTGEGYLMPYEADPNYLQDTAFPVAKLYASLAKLPTKDVTVVLDACFSGQGGRSLIAKGARPLVPVQTANGPANADVLAAAAGSQISASDPERRHGLLTEYLLEALHGAADARGDGKVTTDEIFAYVRPAVQRAAKLQNIEQTPTLWSSPNAAKGGRPWIVLK